MDAKTKATHTPGPWINHGRVSDTDDSISIVGGKTDGYADAVYINVQGENPEAQIANARLIAAAPEMLDALEAIAKAGLVVDITIIYAAIARAKGE